MDVAPTRITIDVVDAAAPVTGFVAVGGSTPQPFSGWTNLFSVLERTVVALRSCQQPSQAVEGQQPGRIRPGEHADVHQGGKRP